ncbi:MAG: nucleotidyltransferase [Bdellovibrionota bacterium]
MTDLTQLLKVLLQSELPFVLIGGYAGISYGTSHVTQDIDICMQLTPATIDQLRHILEQYRPVIRTPQRLSFATNPGDTSQVKNLYLSTTLGPLDILSEVIGVGDFDTVRKNAKKILLFGFQCFVISLDDLIKTKKTLNRPKDQLVLHELEHIRAERST